MNSDQARQQAEKRLKKEERAQDGRQAMIEYKAHALAVREKTACLKALRLAKGVLPVSAQRRSTLRPPNLQPRPSEQFN